MKQTDIVHEFFSIGSEEELLKAYLLAEQKGKPLRFLAGGTDLLIELREPGAGVTLSKSRFEKRSSLIGDISSFSILRGIYLNDKILSVGALSTFGSMLDELPIWAGVLAKSARSIGSPQIRNRATIGGNIANGAPAADSVPSLLLLGAELVMYTYSEGRLDPVTIPLQRYLENREKYKNALIAQIQIREPTKGLRAFYKQGKRNALAISTVSLAAEAIWGSYGTIQPVLRLRLAIGAVTPFAFLFESVIQGDRKEGEARVELADRIADEVVEAMNKRFGPRDSRTHKKEVIAGMLYQFLTEECGE